MLGFTGKVLRDHQEASAVVTTNIGVKTVQPHSNRQICMHASGEDGKVLKVNKNLHQMAIKLTENGFLEKTRKAEQEMPITPELGVNYGIGAAVANVVSEDV